MKNEALNSIVKILIENSPYWHNREYRHSLRCVGDWNDSSWNEQLTEEQFEARYKQARLNLIRVGLKPDGKGKKHQQIIWNTMEGVI